MYPQDTRSGSPHTQFLVVIATPDPYFASDLPDIETAMLIDEFAKRLLYQLPFCLRTSILEGFSEKILVEDNGGPHRLHLQRCVIVHLRNQTVKELEE